MATNRVIVDPNGRQFSCDSMDRFGDDLCQLIVGYLPFEDKTRLEGVAKQWRRVIDYNTIQTLKISRERKSFQWNGYKVIESVDSLVFVMRCDAEEDYKHLKTLLNKCKHIRKIVFNRIDINCPLIAVIDKYCQRLDSLEIIGCQLSEEVITLFGCGLRPNVKRLVFDFNEGLEENQLLANCPNVESLKCSSFSVFSDRSDDFLPKLKSLETTIDANNVSLFPDFVDKYQKQLKGLEFFTAFDNPLSTTQLIDVLNSISRLEVINYLDIVSKNFNQDEGHIDIDRQLEQIGRNCRQLKRFYLLIDPDIKIEGNVWRNFGEFQALESLSLKLDTTVDQSMASMGLKKNLKRIDVEAFEAKEELFANIHQFVPNLESFTFVTDTKLTDKLLDLLSHLNHLKDVFIDPKDTKPKITESGVNRLLDNCPQLTRFDVYGVVEIEISKREKPIIHWNESSDSESESWVTISESSDTESE